jgi:hypothetical protein
MGELPSKICKSLGRSRSKVRKNGLGDTTTPIKAVIRSGSRKSRAPKNVHRKTDSEIEQLVVNV